MKQGFYKYDNRALAFKYGSPEHKFYDYLIKKENYSRLKGSEIGQVEITVRTVAKDIEVSEKIAKKLIKQFVENDFIKLVYKSNSKKKSSIYLLKTYEKVDTVGDTVEDTVEDTDWTQLNKHIASVDCIEGHGLDTVEDTVEDTVGDTSKKELIKRINKKEFINNNIEHLDQNKFGHDSVEQQAFKNNVISLEVNKKEKDQLIKEQCDLLWSKYPNKKGKAKAYKKMHKLLKEYSLEELTRCVDRYRKEIQIQGIEKQFIKQGDTFFNSGYVDYLDENYEEPLQEQSKKFIPNYKLPDKLPGENKVGVRVHETFRQYEPDELEKLLLESQKGKFN